MSRVSNSDGPGRTYGVVAAQIEVAARIDDEIAQPLQFARCHVDSKPFGDRSQIQHERAIQGDRPRAGIKLNVAISSGIIRFQRRSHSTSRAVFLVETERLHGIADRGVECASGFVGYRDGKLHGFVEDVTRRHRDADPSRKSSEFAALIEARTTLFNAAKPVQGSPNRFFKRICRLLRAGVAIQYLDRN